MLEKLLCFDWFVASLFLQLGKAMCVCVDSQWLEDVLYLMRHQSGLRLEKVAIPLAGRRT